MWHFLCVGVKKSITLKDSEARGFSGQLTRTKIAENQSLIKLVLGAATALVDRSISSYGISSISSRRRRRIGGSSSIRAALVELLCVVASVLHSVMVVVNRSSLKTFQWLKQENLHATVKIVHLSFFSSLPKHVRLSLFCCRAFLHLCCSKHSSRWATQACLYLPYSQTNQPNEAGDRLAEDLWKTTPKHGWPSHGYVSLHSHGGRCFQ